MRFGLVMMVLATGVLVLAGGCKRKEENTAGQKVASELKAAPQQSYTMQPAQETPREAPAAPQNAQAPQNVVLAPIVIQTKAEFEIPSAFRCKNNTHFNAVFTRNPDTVRITFPGRVTVTLPRKQVSGRGFWYENANYTLRGQGPNAVWIMKNHTPVECVNAVYELSNDLDAKR